MPLQNFIDNQAPTIKAAWLNAVDAFYFTLFNSATTAAAARTAISAAKSAANTDITSLASPDIASATAVTQAAGDNSTKVATTAYVIGARTTVNVYTKNQSVLPVQMANASTVPIDASLSNNFKTVSTGFSQSFTLQNPTNLTDGMVLNFRFRQDATGGRVMTPGSKYKGAGGGSSLVLSTAPNAVDFMSCYYDLDSDTLDCVLNKAFA